jgi:hypothetical protein
MYCFRQYSDRDSFSTMMQHHHEWQPKKSMEEFVRLHKPQLDALNIPEPLHEGLKRQLEAIFCLNQDEVEGEEQGEDSDDRSANHNRTGRERLLDSTLKMLEEHDEQHAAKPYGSILVVPHLCSWDMRNHRGMWQELSKLPDSALRRVRDALERLAARPCPAPDDDDPNSAVQQQELSEGLRKEVMEDILRLGAWSTVILYRAKKDGDDPGHGDLPTVRAALPVPPYFPHVQFENLHKLETKEADLTGPFPLRYHKSSCEVIETSLVYASPGVSISSPRWLPTVDVAPHHTFPDLLTRCVRYAALLSDSSQVPACVGKRLGDYYQAFLATVDSQHNLQRSLAGWSPEIPVKPSSDDDCESNSSRVLKVFTDSNDPIGLSHPEAGLTDPHFELVDSISEADVVFSYQSLFAPAGPLRKALNARQQQRQQSPPPLINQFPYEGAFVQKDHLARELWSQYGVTRRPAWAIESYDLDVQFVPFVARAWGAVVEERDGGKAPSLAWIIKPARGTQSKGHLVTRSLAHVCRLLDADGGTTSRVAQRYIENPVCYRRRKVDCRCVVIMTDASPGYPTLYMHNRVFLRIAHKPHEISNPSSLMDPETVLTATHLLHETERSSPDESLQLLPVDTETIRELEETYGFSWSTSVLPKIHTMIRELFDGMTLAFPAMSSNPNARAVYGVDVMFELLPNGEVQPKLTEVTFCPANNATCEAYARDVGLYRSYINDVFNCMFRGVIAESLTKLQ